MSKINSVGNAFATSNDEIIDGLERSASAMASTGASLEDTIAILQAVKKSYKMLKVLVRQ